MRTRALTNPTADQPLQYRLGGRDGWADRIRGIALVGVLAMLAIQLAGIDWLQANGISALTLAIVLGMIAGNTFYPRIASTCAPGVTFSKQTLLRTGIILYGLRLTFQDIANVGMTGVAIDVVVLSSTFILSWWLGTRVFGLDRRTAMLVGAGSSICGAAAVMATEPVVGARAEQVIVAVSTVVVFGTVAIFLYPTLYHLNAHYHVLHMSPASFGIYAGSTIHEVAQVVAAGRSISESAANTAVITKMVRVMLLAPFLVILSIYLSRNGDPSAARSPGGARPRTAIVVPWFALGFIAVAAFNSLSMLPKSITAPAIRLDTFILAMAMAALGVTTHASAIRKAGLKPLALASLLFAWLILGGFAINRGISALIG
ncbi:MAG TPA: YeiH family protein [Steroidobacteraceae bacterium]|nr:YeiH family protein [Steroidobacteraceae bacterium]